MDESLKEYNLATSEFKILHNSLVGGESYTTKFPWREQPALARLSAHLFASLKTWMILIQWIYPRRYLQSLSKEEYELLIGFLDRIRLTITWVSNSTSIWVMPSWVGSISPSLKAQNSATILLALPIFLMYPLIHFP